MNFRFLLTVGILTAFLFTQVLPAPVWAQEGLFGEPNTDFKGALKSFKDLFEQGKVELEAAKAAKALPPPAKGKAGPKVKPETVIKTELSKLMRDIAESRRTNFSQLNVLEKVTSLRLELEVGQYLKANGAMTDIPSSIVTQLRDVASALKSTPKEPTKLPESIRPTIKGFNQTTPLEDITIPSGTSKKGTPTKARVIKGMLSLFDDYFQKISDIVLAVSDKDQASQYRGSGVVPGDVIEKLSALERVMQAAELDEFMQNKGKFVPASTNLTSFNARMKQLLTKADFEILTDPSPDKGLTKDVAVQAAGNAQALVAHMTEEEQLAWKTDHKNLTSFLNKLEGPVAGGGQGLMSKAEWTDFQKTKTVPSKFAKVAALEGLSLKAEDLAAAVKEFKASGTLPADLNAILKDPAVRTAFLEQGTLPPDFIKASLRTFFNDINLKKGLWGEILKLVAPAGDQKGITQETLAEFIAQALEHKKLPLKVLANLLRVNLEGAPNAVAAALKDSLKALIAEMPKGAAVAAPLLTEEQLAANALRAAKKSAPWWQRVKTGYADACTKYPGSSRVVHGGLGAIVVYWLSAAVAAPMVRITTGEWTTAWDESTSRLISLANPWILGGIFAVGGGFTYGHKRAVEFLLKRKIDKEMGKGLAKEAAEEIAKKYVSRINWFVGIFMAGLLVNDVRNTVLMAEAKLKVLQANLIDSATGTLRPSNTQSFDEFMKKTITPPATPSGGGGGSYHIVPPVYAASIKSGVVGNNAVTRDAVTLCLLEDPNIAPHDIESFFAGDKESLMKKTQTAAFADCIEEVAVELRNEKRDEFINAMLSAVRGLHKELDEEWRTIKALKGAQQEANLFNNAQNEWHRRKLLQAQEELGTAGYALSDVTGATMGARPEFLVDVLSNDSTWMGQQVRQKGVNPQAYAVLSQRESAPTSPLARLWERLGPWGQVNKTREVENIIGQHLAPYAQQRFFTKEALEKEQARLRSIPEDLARAQERYQKAAEEFVFENGYYQEGLALQQELDRLEAQRALEPNASRKTALIKDDMLQAMDWMENIIRDTKQQLFPNDRGIKKGYLRDPLFLGDEGIEKFYSFLKEIAAILASEVGVMDSAKIVFERGKECKSEQVPTVPLPETSVKVQGTVIAVKVEADTAQNIPAGVFVVGTNIFIPAGDSLVLEGKDIPLQENSVFSDKNLMAIFQGKPFVQAMPQGSGYAVTFYVFFKDSAPQELDINGNKVPVQVIEAPLDAILPLK